MAFNTSSTLALGSLGGAIGAILANSPTAQKSFFSKERFIGGLLGTGLGLAAGQVLQSTQNANLGALALSDAVGTPLKRQPITIRRTDSGAGLTCRCWPTGFYSPANP